MPTLQHVNDAVYADGVPFGIQEHEDSIIREALVILERRLLNRKHESNSCFTEPAEMKSFFKLKLAHLEHEVFSVAFMDSRHYLIEVVDLFRGTIDGASVFPREVVKEALSRNAAAVIFAHNHPSGVTEPSRADENITRRLKEALSLVEVHVLDHIIVGEGEPVSMAERNFFLRSY